MATERLQKILAASGRCSRRAAEALITAGRVRVNGQVTATLGSRADAQRDRIEVDGQRIVLARPVHYLYFKPRAVVSTLHDPEGRRTVQHDLRALRQRVFPVGRLDYHTSGALLLTNDGGLSDALLRPEARVPKVYVAKVQGHVETEALAQLRQGVRLEDGVRTRPAEVIVLREDTRHSWLQITLHEGKNRQIHRMGEAVGHRVMRLARLSFAGLTTEGMRPGQLRPVSEKELRTLKRQYLRSGPRRRGRKPGEKNAPGSRNAPTAIDSDGE
ncbi:MAG: pseudouridine synthase [Polyangiales bacterium]